MPVGETAQIERPSAYWNGSLRDKTSANERAAYLAANQILSADLESPQYACPGKRRSVRLERIAGIIMGVLEVNREF